MGVDAVIFDWGGTLTPWRNHDGQSWSRIATHLMESAEPSAVAAVAALLAAAEDDVWRRAREEHRSGTLDEIFAAAGLPATDAAHAAVDAEWDWATHLDPDVPALSSRAYANATCASASCPTPVGGGRATSRSSPATASTTLSTAPSTPRTSVDEAASRGLPRRDGGGRCR
jgi:hypothetical protein